MPLSHQIKKYIRKLSSYLKRLSNQSCSLTKKPFSDVYIIMVLSLILSLSRQPSIRPELLSIL
jgi:hypothetical protein